MRDFALVLIVFGSLPLILLQPQIGILMWFWLSLMNPHRLTWGYAYDLRVALVVAVGTIVAWLLSRERKLPPLTMTTYLLAAFTLWVTLSTFFALVPESAWVKWQEVIKILAMTFVATCIVNSRKRIEQLVWVVAFSIGFYGIKGGVFALLTGGQYRLWGPPDSFIGDNNALALALIMILPLLHFLALNTKDRRLRYALWVAMGLTTLATLCTYSRGGFLALGITATAFWLKTRHRLLTGVAVVALMGSSLASLPESWYERMDTIVHYQQDTSANERLTVWRYATRLAADHPLVGGGFNVVDDPQLYFRYSPEADAVHNFHSIYFQVLGENGYVGLALFLGLILASMLTAQRIIRTVRGRPELAWGGQLASAIQISIVGYCAAGAFLNLGFYDLFYALVAIITCTQVAVAQAAMEQPALKDCGATPIWSPFGSPNSLAQAATASQDGGKR